MFSLFFVFVTPLEHRNRTEFWFWFYMFSLFFVFVTPLEHRNRTEFSEEGKNLIGLTSALDDYFFKFQMFYCVYVM
jgi:hypothetical protein